MGSQRVRHDWATFTLTHLRLFYDCCIQWFFNCGQFCPQRTKATSGDIFYCSTWSALKAEVTGKMWLSGKESICQEGDVEDGSSILGSGRSLEEGNGNPLQYFWLENPMDKRSLGGYSPSGCKESDMTEHSTERQVETTDVTKHRTMHRTICHNKGLSDSSFQ